MKTHKIARSFTAMFWGWLAANAALGLPVMVWTLVEQLSGNRAPVPALSMLILAAYALFCSAVVVIGAWLIFFLPADLLVSDDSPLRAPGKAAACGGAAGFGVMFLMFLDGSDVPFGPGLSFLRHPVFLWLAGGATACGLTAALSLVRNHPRTTGNAGRFRKR